MSPDRSPTEAASPEPRAFVDEPGLVPEARLIGLVGCPRPRPGDDDRIACLLEAGVDWTVLVRQALAHGVAPLLASRLQAAPTGLVPDDIRAALAAHDQGNRGRVGYLLSELSTVLGRLRERDVQAVPFKGPVLAHLAYGDAALRPAGDLDLLLRETDVTAACRVLTDLGFVEYESLRCGRPLTPREDRWYRRYQCEYGFVRETDGLHVEPHWRFAPWQMALPGDDGLWDRLTDVRLETGSVTGLSVEDLLYGLCVHGAKHQWVKLFWVSDVAALVGSHPGLDWEVTVDRASRDGARRLLLLGLRLAQCVGGADLPDFVRRAVRDDPRVDELTAGVTGALVPRSDGRRPEVRPVRARSIYQLSRFRIRMRERVRDRLRHVWLTVTVPRIEHVTLVPLPPGLGLLYYVIKVAADYLVVPVRDLTRRAGRSPAETSSPPLPTGE